MSIFVDIEKKLGDFSLQVCFEAGDETLALLGASGCGKSMTLKCIAGIEKPDRGKIVLDGRVLFDSEKKIDLTPQECRTGLLFQSYALFPNMTVEQNIRAGAVRCGSSKEKVRVVREMMERFEIAELAGHYPAQLSGGQKQRTALARLLASQPEVLLLDEPFSALDSHLRLRLEQEMREHIREFGKTVLFVSHDREEVYRMSDSVALMNRGRIERIGKKQDVFSDPQTVNGARLLGCRNIFSAEYVDEKTIFVPALGENIEIGSAAGVTAVGFGSRGIGLAGVTAGARAGSDSSESCAAEGGAENRIRCRVETEVESPDFYTLLLRPEGGAKDSCLYWDVDRAFWQERRCETVDIRILREAFYLLKDG